MKAWLPFAALLMLGAVQDTATFSSPQLGLLFDYPKEWKMSKRRDVTTFEISVDGAARGTLEVHAVSFESEKERWQKIQEGIGTQLGREIERQWEEVLLGVPVLLTKMRGQDQGVPNATLTGLLYTATPRKLFFRLSASPEQFSQIEPSFREVLSTLRTADGKLPRPEDPTRPPEDIAKRPEPPNTLPKKLEPTVGAKPTVKGPVKIEIAVSGRANVLSVPEGWTLTPKDQSVELSHPSLSTPLLVTLHSTLDSERPVIALLKAGARSLEAFEKVDKRSDTNPKRNAAGAEVATVWRTGTTKEGPLTTLEAVGALGEGYWMLAARWTAAPTPAERKLILSLLEGMSLDPAGS